MCQTALGCSCPKRAPSPPSGNRDKATENLFPCLCKHTQPKIGKFNSTFEAQITVIEAFKNKKRFVLKYPVSYKEFSK